MLGGIYTNQKCPICGSALKDNGKSGVICRNHPEQRAIRLFVKIKGVWRRFKDYDEAHRFLTGLRYKIDEGTFDERDYRQDNPLGFIALATQWLEIKKQKVKPKSFNNLNNYMSRSINFFGNKNIKEIGYADLEDFLLSQKISDKTKANIKSCLHDFWEWLRKRKIITIQQLPEFPEVAYELGYRNIVSKDDQESILNELHRISYNINPKIYLGIKFLCTYISIRPGELLSLKEGDIDKGNGYLLFPHPKEKRPKLVPILEEDVELLKTFPSSIPSLHFFRHVKGVSGVSEGEPFGEKYFYKWWYRACENLGIKGVDLYGGTRHSSARALRQYCTPEEIKRATMHSTNKAFERYFRIEGDDLRSIYRKTTAPKLHQKKEQSEKDNILIFKD
jgi:integrase